jgi:hypothetical protein
VTERSVAAELAGIVIRGLRAGHCVRIDELGTFYPDPVAGLRFEARVAPQVFIAYAKEDGALAERLADDLEAAGFRPWIDVRRLLAGQNWPRAIDGAIESSDFFVPCFSSRSVGKRGGFQAEIRYALDCARRVPLDDVFVLPVRLDECRVPHSIQREVQYIDLFPCWPAGMRKLETAITRALARRTPA